MIILTWYSSKEYTITEAIISISSFSGCVDICHKREYYQNIREVLLRIIYESLRINYLLIFIVHIIHDKIQINIFYSKNSNLITFTYIYHMIHKNRKTKNRFHGTS